MQNAGIVDMTRQQLPSGDYGYSFTTTTSMMAGDNQANAEINSAPMLLMRDAENRVITGGYDCLKEVGEVGNMALSLSNAKIIPDNKWRHYELPMKPTSFYPAMPGFNIKYTTVTSRAFGQCLLVTAVSDFFVCSVPGEKQPLTGIYKIVMLSDPSQRNMYYRCSGYEARMGQEQVNVKDNFWLANPETGEPRDISDIRSVIDREVSSIYMPDKGVLQSNTTVPPWAVHALSVKRYMDVTCGAVIEGRPNCPAFVAVAGFLLVDSVVSTASELLAAGVKKATGKDIPVYQGIPNYVGQGIGWGGAKVYETATGNKADTEKWKSVGGDVVDFASTFLPSGVASKGLKLLGKGAKVAVADGKILNQAIRIGKYAIPFATAEKLGKLFDWKTRLQKVQKLAEWLWSPTGPGSVPGSGGGPGGGSIPGGITFEGSLGGFSPKSVKYQAKDNTFVINSNIAYASPLPAAEMAAMLRHVAAEDGFSMSLAGAVKGAVNKENRFYPMLADCDRYLGNIIFGRLKQLPEGCVAHPDYKPHRAPAGTPGCVCAVFNFRYRFSMERNVITRRNLQLEVSLIPYSREKAEKEGVYEYAEPKENDMKALEAYEKNVESFQPAFYLKQPAVMKVTTIGEAAVFALWLKQHGIVLEALAEAVANSKAGAAATHPARQRWTATTIPQPSAI